MDAFTGSELSTGQRHRSAAKQSIHVESSRLTRNWAASLQKIGSPVRVADSSDSSSSDTRLLHKIRAVELVRHSIGNSETGDRESLRPDRES